jgi:esterase
VSLKLFHRDFGSPGLPPLVVLHGLLGSSRNWQSAGRDLAARFHVLAPDLRNHGQSPHDSDASYEALVGDVLAWLDAQGLGRVSLLGHSMGGKVAMLLATRHPERVERLIVVDIAPKDYLSLSHRSEFAAMNELRLDTLSSRKQAELLLEARVPDWAMRKFLLTNLEWDEQSAWRWSINLPTLTESLPLLEKNPLDAASRFFGPSLFICGGKSNYVLPGDHQLIGHFFPSSRIASIAEAGHNPHMDSREAFVSLV